MREDVTPLTGSPNGHFEATHFLHAEDFFVREIESFVLLAQSFRDGAEVGRAVFVEHRVAIVVTFYFIPDVFQASISGTRLG